MHSSNKTKEEIKDGKNSKQAINFLFHLMIVYRSKDLQTKTFKVPELTTLRLELSVLHTKGENGNQLLTCPAQ